MDYFQIDCGNTTCISYHEDVDCEIKECKRYKKEKRYFPCKVAEGTLFLCSSVLKAISTIEKLAEGDESENLFMIPFICDKYKKQTKIIVSKNNCGFRLHKITDYLR